MAKECSIIKDLLSLYAEGMLSEETTEYVKEHLKNCPDCMSTLGALQQPNGVDITLPGENKSHTSDVEPLKRIKQKIKRNKLLTVLAAVVLTIIAVVSVSLLKPATFDYGNSEIYSIEDRKEAVQIIENKFNSWDGCKLYSISYTSDELCKRELDYCNTLAKDGTEYAECIVFRSRFRSPIFNAGAWNPNSEYNWSWYLARTENGNWELLTWGFA